MEEHESLMNKPVSELTMKDHLKVNAVVLAGMAGIAVIAGGVGYLREKNAQRKFNKNLAKFQDELSDV